jgi:uncharacterized protein (TIRG00374 family)
MRQKWLRLGLRLLGPALLVVLVLRMKNGGEVLRGFQGASLAPLIAAIGLNFVNLQLKVSRWRVILRAQGAHYPMRRAWSAYMSSSYVALLTPGRVGDGLRAQYLHHDEGVPYADGIASVVMDRLCDLYVLVVFSGIGLIRFSAALDERLTFLAWGTLSLILLGPLVLFVPRLAEKLMAQAYRKFGKNTDPKGFSRFLAALRKGLGPSLPLTLLLTLLAFMANFGQAFLLAHALNLPLSFFDSMCLVSIASMLGLLPISVSGLGVRELFFSVAFPILGLSANAGISFGLAIFGVLYLMLVGVGFVFWQIAPPPMASTIAAAASPSDPHKKEGARPT